MSDECPADCQCEYVCEQPYRRINELEAELTRLRGLIRDNGTPRFNEVCRRAEAAEAELARLRAPVEGEAGEMVKRLKDHEPVIDEGIVLHDLSYMETSTLETAADVITRQAASLREAVDVMRPFAKHGEFVDFHFSDDPDDTVAAGLPDNPITLGHFRRARAWLAKHQGDKP